MFLAEAHMRVVILGGTGFIGSALVKALLRAGHDVTVSSRRARPHADGGPAYARWDGQSPQALAEICKGAAAVVNLLGENIGAGRWTVARRETIVQSRVRAGEAVTAAFGLLDKAGDALPKTLIQASASGWYGLWPDLATAPDCTEDAPAGSGFLAEVVRRWEASSAPVEALGVRRVRIRTAPVLGKGGGVLARMLPLYRWGLGGPAGTGRQPFPWIHLDDEAGAIVFLLEHPEISGPCNLCAPEQTDATGFARALGRALHRPAFLRVPAVVLRLALGQMAEELLLNGQRCAPRTLLEADYVFRYPKLSGALTASV